MRNLRAAAVVLSVIIGGATIGFGFHGYFAKATELQEVSAIQTLHILSVKLHDVRTQLWDLQKQYGRRCEHAEPKTRAYCHTLIEQEEYLMRRLQQQQFK